MKGEKGQSAIEVIFILGVVFIISTAILGRYTSIQDQNIAMSYAKIKAVENISAQGNEYYIKSIEAQENSGVLDLYITTVPGTIGFSSPSAQEIANEIKCRTSYNEVKLHLNSNEVTGSC